jgi:hypothetical protein
MKTRIGTFQLSLIFTGLIVLFALLMMWPNKASYFHDAPKQAVENLSASTISEKVMALGDHHALPYLWNNSFNGS